MLSLLLLVGKSTGFSPRSIRGKAFQNTVRNPSTSSALKVKSYSDEDASFIMEQASECAYSDNCSIDDAHTYLEAVVSVQGNCAANVLTNDAVCGDADQISEIISLLRLKAESSEAMNMELAASEGEGKFSLIPIYAVMAGLTLAVSTTLNHGQDVTSFTTEEWFWALRDGYLDTMVSAYLKNGGMVAETSLMDTLDITSVHLPFTSQEWMWAIRDGYVDDMVSAAIRNGGL